MALDHWLSNFTITANDTGQLDFYCTEYISPLVWASFSGLLACVGLPACVWLLWVLVQRRRRGLAFDVYMVNLTVVDLIFNTFIPLAILNTFVWRDDLFLEAGIFLVGFNAAGRPLFTVCTCFDCYLAAVYPIIYMKMKHSRCRLISSALIWALTVAYGLVYVYQKQLIYSPLCMTPVIVSLPTIVFFDVSVLRALQKPDPCGRRSVHPQKEKALRTLTYNLAMTIVAYLPPVVVFGFSSLIPMTPQSFYCCLAVPAGIPPALFSAIMPVLYLSNLGVLKQLMRCLKSV